MFLWEFFFNYLEEQSVAGSSTNCNINSIYSYETKKKRKRNITWYNLPFSKNIIGRLFLKLIEEFWEEHLPHPVFNKNTLKVFYCRMKSVEDIIDSHNHKLLANKEQHSTQDQLTKLCNCQSETDCPLRRKCLLSTIIYQAKVRELYWSDGDNF